MLNNVRLFLKSFVYAFRGIATAVKTQRNFRFHIIAMIYVIAFSLFYDLTKSEYAILILTFAAVISLELVNTALENAIDLCSPEYNKLAEISKNCSAGAVLVSAIAAVVVGIFIFADAEIFAVIVKFYIGNQIALAGLVLFAIFSVIFVYGLFNEKKGK